MCEGRFHKLYLDVQSGMSYLLLWPLPLRKDLGVFKKVSGLDQALEDEKKGKVKKYKNSEDLFKKVLG